MTAQATVGAASSAPAMRAVWLVVALTLPLFGVDFLRASSESWGLHLAVPMIGLLVMLAIGGVMILMRDARLPRPLILPAHRPALVALYIFLVWHVWSLLMTSHFTAGRKEVVKLAVSLVCFWGTLAFFPRDRRFLVRFFSIALWSSMILIGILIYIYIFVLHSLYLGTHPGEETKQGRAQLAWYMSMLFPLAFFYLWKARARAWSLLPTMVLVIALLYNQTRGAWISVAAGLAFAVAFTWRSSGRQAAKLAALIAGSGALMIAVAVLILAQYVDLTEFVARVVSVFWPEDVPQWHSYERRWELITGAFQAYLTSPVVGVGVGDTTEFLVRITHNDVMTVLLELGLVGIVLFAVVILLVSWASGMFRARRAGEIDWLTLAVPATVINWIMSMMFINVYTSVQFWVFPALFMVAGSLPEEPQRAPVRRIGRLRSAMRAAAVRARA